MLDVIMIAGPHDTLGHTSLKIIGIFSIQPKPLLLSHRAFITEELRQDIAAVLGENATGHH